MAPTHSPPPPGPESRGEQARSAVEDVLRDQAERARRRDHGGPPPPKDRGPALLAFSAVLLGAAAWLWAAPPSWIQPAPPPPPPPSLVEAEVRLTAYQAVLRLDAFRDSTGVYPESLAEVLEAPEDQEGLSYQRLSAGRFRILARREGATVSYDSSEPVSTLLAGAPRTLEEVRP